MTTTAEDTLALDPITKLSRDLKKAAATLSHAEVRYLVDYYYQMQRDRIRAANQVRATSEAEEPHEVLRWVAENTEVLEANIKRALDAYTDAHEVGRWSKSIVGIGPVIAAGLLAHLELDPWSCAVAKLDLTHKTKPCKPDAPHGPACQRLRINTVGKIWRFAGLDPTVTWGQGQKRPWNARLKTLCWKIGESFVKQSGRESDFYGKLYLQRKAIEIEKNEAGAFADQAKVSLSTKNFREDTIARQHYEKGQLPPARIHLRAQRWAVKLFLAHWHHVAYVTTFGEQPPKPYALSILGHADEIQVPNWPLPTKKKP